MKIYEASLRFALVSEGRSRLVNNPALTVGYMADAFTENPMQESFWVISLNRWSRAIARTCISRGSVTGTVAHPREVFRAAVLATATAIVVVHNHPSGNPAPSRQDVTVTRMLREAARVIDIQLIDHVIVGDKEEDPTGKGYFSFREAGMI